MKTEKYYAVRIGSEPDSIPYLMISDDGVTPALFATKHEAVEAAGKRPGRKAVAVYINFIAT